MPDNSETNAGSDYANRIGGEKVGDMTLAELSSKLAAYERLMRANAAPSAPIQVTSAQQSQRAPRNAPKKRIEPSAKPARGGAFSEGSFGRYIMPILASTLFIAAIIVALSVAWDNIPDAMKVIILVAIGGAIWAVGAKLSVGSAIRPFWYGIIGAGSGTVYAALASGGIIWGFYNAAACAIFLSVWFGAVFAMGVRLKSNIILSCARAGGVLTLWLALYPYLSGSQYGAYGGVGAAILLIILAAGPAIAGVMTCGEGEYAQSCLSAISALVQIYVIAGSPGIGNGGAFYLWSAVIISALLAGVALFSLRNALPYKASNGALYLLPAAIVSLTALYPSAYIVADSGMPPAAMLVYAAALICQIFVQRRYYTAGISLAASLAMAYASQGEFSFAIACAPAIVYAGMSRLDGDGDSLPYRIGFLSWTAAVIVCIGAGAYMPYSGGIGDILKISGCVACAAAVAAYIIVSYRRDSFVSAPLDVTILCLCMWPALSSAIDEGLWACAILLIALQLPWLFGLSDFSSYTVPRILWYPLFLIVFAASMLGVGFSDAKIASGAVALACVLAAVVQCLACAKGDGVWCVASLATAAAMCYGAGAGLDVENWAYVDVTVIILATVAIWYGFRYDRVALRRSGLILATACSLKAPIANMGNMPTLGLAGALLVAGGACFCVALLYNRLWKTYSPDAYNDSKGD